LITANDSASLAVGGLSGRFSGTVSDSFTKGTINAATSVGGIVGTSSSVSIINSFSESNVTGTGTNIGGIVGSINASSISSVTNSYSTGNITGSDLVGGIAGSLTAIVSIQNNYQLGNIVGRTQVGGIVGQTSGSNLRYNNNLSIGNVTATIANPQNVTNVGPIFGLVGSTISQSNN